MGPSHRDCAYTGPPPSSSWYSDSEASLSAFQSPDDQSPEPPQQPQQQPQQPYQPPPRLTQEQKERVHAVALEWKRLYGMLDDHPARPLNLIKAYKRCGFNTRFHEIFNNLPISGDDSQMHFNFESHYPAPREYDPAEEEKKKSDDEKDEPSFMSEEVLKAYFVVLQPHLEVACGAADAAYEELMKLINLDLKTQSDDDGKSQKSTVQSVSNVLIQIATLHRHLHAIGTYRKLVRSNETH